MCTSLPLSHEEPSVLLYSIFCVSTPKTSLPHKWYLKQAERRRVLEVCTNRNERKNFRRLSVAMPGAGGVRGELSWGVTLFDS